MISELDLWMNKNPKVVNVAGMQERSKKEPGGTRKTSMVWITQGLKVGQAVVIYLTFKDN